MKFAIKQSLFSVGGATEQLPGLLSTLFNYLNILPSRLQGVVCDSCCSVLSRKAICSSCASLNPEKFAARQCQVCFVIAKFKV